MKQILILLVIVGTALVAFNYFTTGELKLVPSLSKSEDEVALDGLKARFEAAQNQYAQAHRMVGLVGVDTTAEVEAAILSAKQVDKDLAALLHRQTAERTKQKAVNLSRAVKAFLTDAG